MRKEDIVIIGGGVGGLTVAKTLALDGISPLLLERNKEFGQKACGEMLAKEFWGFNIDDFLKDERVILRKFDQMIFKFGEKEFYFNLKNPKFPLREMFSIDKKAFEESLAREAEKRGAKIFLGKEVKKLVRIKNSILINDEIEAKLVIGADGFHSIVRKFVGQKFKEFGFAFSGYGQCQIEIPYFIFDPEISMAGYGWIFPRRGKEANIGFGGGQIKEVKNCLEKFLKKFNLKIEKVRGAFLPIQLPKRNFFDNILLVGDAASLTNPFWGSGIDTALVSGYLAAKTAKEAIGKGETSSKFLKKYEKEWRKKMFKKLFRNYLFQKIFAQFLFHQKKLTFWGLNLLSKLSWKE